MPFFDLSRPFDMTKITTVAVWAASAWIIYVVCLVLYRLCFSPLASIPGPDITAMTGWYESYCDLIRNGGGSFTKLIHSWHEKYGPIVRINPWEVHISDPEYYESIYSTALPFDKLKAHEGRFNAPHAAFCTTKSKTHRKRRGALNPFFSKSKVIDYVPIIRGRVQRLCRRLQAEFAGKQRVLHLNDVFGCFTTDTVVDYSFDMGTDLIDEPDFKAQFASAVRDLQSSMHFGEAFPWMMPIIDALPQSIIGALFPPVKSILDFRKELRNLVKLSRDRFQSGGKSRSQEIVFDELLHSDLPESELSASRLEQEALSIVSAGLDSTKTVACVFSFHVLADPEILARLREELEQVMPQEYDLPRLEVVEALPYFGACLNEALRLSYGTASRSPRVCNDRALVYKDYVIPAGTPVSTQTYTMHHNEDVFPDSWSFKPERWLGNARGPGGKPLSRYLVAYGRGTRSCLGMHLANAMLYTILPMMFRNFNLELYETDRDAVDCFSTALGPMPKGGTKGVRVLVK